MLSFHRPPTPWIYTLSLHDALPIYGRDPHRDGHPSSEDRAREHVAAQIVGAEKMFRAGALERHREVDVVDPRVVHERPDEDEDHERDEREQTRHGEPVPTELVPGIAP